MPSSIGAVRSLELSIPVDYSRYFSSEC